MLKDTEKEEFLRECKALGHVPKYKDEGFMLDGFTCSCGWESIGYFDGADYAYSDWVKHVKPLVKSKEE